MALKSCQKALCWWRLCARSFLVFLSVINCFLYLTANYLPTTFSFPFRFPFVSIPNMAWGLIKNWSDDGWLKTDNAGTASLYWWTFGNCPVVNPNLVIFIFNIPDTFSNLFLVTTEFHSFSDNITKHYTDHYTGHCTGNYPALSV